MNSDFLFLCLGRDSCPDGTSAEFARLGRTDQLWPFEKGQPRTVPKLDPPFTLTLENPTVTVSYLNRTRFDTTRVHPTKVLNA